MSRSATFRKGNSFLFTSPSRDSAAKRCVQRAWHALATHRANPREIPNVARAFGGNGDARIDRRRGDGAVALRAARSAQDAGRPGNSQPHRQRLRRLPENPQVFGTAMPSVVKATAIVNGDVITQTDVDQRLSLSSRSPTAARFRRSRSRLRQQVLRNLIDEKLEIQAAKADKMRSRRRTSTRRSTASPRTSRRRRPNFVDYPARHRLVTAIDASPDPRRNRLAAAASAQGRAAGQRRRRRGQGGHRQAHRGQGQARNITSAKSSCRRRRQPRADAR